MSERFPCEDLKEKYATPSTAEDYQFYRAQTTADSGWPGLDICELVEIRTPEGVLVDLDLQH